MRPPEMRSLRAAIEQRRAVIDDVFRLNLVPHTALVVLILLQAFEVNQVGDLSRTGFVRYYKFLIDNLVLRHVTASEAELVYALVPEMAYWHHKRHAEGLSHEDVDKLITEFSERRALRKIDLFHIYSRLIQIGLFSNDGTNISFRHKYTYYFFLGDYLATNINQASVEVEIQNLATRIAEDECRKILMFLSFHADSSVIADTVMAKLASCFPGAQEFDFTQKGTEAVNRLISEAPQLIVDASEFERNREKHWR